MPDKPSTLKVRRYAVSVPVMIEVEVHAVTAKMAAGAATDWANWIAPTWEQFLDYSEDHLQAALLSEGTMIVGTPKVTEVTDA